MLSCWNFFRACQLVCSNVGDQLGLPVRDRYPRVSVFVILLLGLVNFLRENRGGSWQWLELTAENWVMNLMAVLGDLGRFISWGIAFHCHLSISPLLWVVYSVQELPFPQIQKANFSLFQVRGRRPSWKHS